MPTNIVPSVLDRLLDHVRREAEEAGVFGPVSIRNGTLVCQAKASAAPASYRIAAEGGKLWVLLVTADRWLSESIEGDLMHTGDKIEELIDEELVELGGASDPRPCEHFRSDDLLFTFRTAIPLGAQGIESTDAPGRAARWLLAYEAAFRRLGDMEASEDE